MKQLTSKYEPVQELIYVKVFTGIYALSVDEAQTLISEIEGAIDMHEQAVASSTNNSEAKGFSGFVTVTPEAKQRLMDEHGLTEADFWEARDDNDDE